MLSNPITMNTTLSLARAVPRCLLASLLLPSLPLAAQTITNPSFETNTFATFPGYTDGGGNGPITGWTATPANRVGQNPAAGSPFANNGAIPNGTNVAFIQAGATGAASLKTTATGLTVGTKYNVSFRMNARSQNTLNFPHMVFSTNGTGAPISTEVARVSGAVDATPYHYAAFEFTATDVSQEITITNARTTGDHTLLIDEFAIAPSSNAWAFAQWNGDADSGIDSQYVYTHAYSFGSNPGVTINGVRFIGREGGTAGRFTLSGLNNGFTDRTPNNVTGESQKLAKDFRYGGAPGITLENLKPNTQYVATIYGLGFDAGDSATPHRSSTFSSSVPNSQKFTANLNHFGQGSGMRVTYTYTTDASGTPVTINYPTHGSGTFHTSAFSNREAVASTPTPAWNTVAWNDDATSGVDGSYHYTHAFNFGTATSVNVNGVSFTGVAGANPAGTNYTSTLPGVFNNDTNNTVTGFGAELTKDFVHAGFPAVHNLSGLTPGKAYVFTIYSTGWEAAGGRVNGLFGNPSDAPVFLDQDEFGAQNGIRIEYHYTANASGTAKIVTSAYDGLAPLHVCAISNRETTPLANVAPSITLQPLDAAVGTGKDHLLRVGAVGSATLTYQWKRNNVDIDGATGPVLELPSIDFADAGDYTVVVTNGVNNVTSEVATIVVLDNVPGVFGTGVGVDGTPLANGQIDPHFTLIANPDNTESSEVRIQSNIAGTWLPNSASSKWIGPRTDTAGAAGIPSADGEGEGVYVYRTQLDLTGFDPASIVITGSWATDNGGTAIRVNGTVVAGVVNDTGVTYGGLKAFTLNASNATFISGINNLDFVVRNDAVGLTGLRVDGLKAIGFIAPNTPPHIVNQPLGRTGLHNQNVVLSVDASGSAPLSYEWYHNDILIDGETQSTLNIPIMDLTAGGDYRVKVINGVNNVMSNEVVVTVTNGNPVSEFDEASTVKNVPLAIDAFALLTNDVDPDQDFLEVTGVSATSTQGGTVSLSAGVITYTPPTGFSGSDGFTYTVTDGVWGGTATGNVLVTVSAAANPPPGPVTIVLQGGTATASFTGTVGVSYTLQRSVLLSSGWTDVETVVAPPSGLVSMVDEEPPVGKAFYRVIYTP